MENREERVFSIKELLAMCVRKLKVLIVWVVIFAMLFGAFQLYRQIKASKDPEHSETKIEERYQEALREYEKQVKDIEDSIEDNEKAKADKEEYLEKSLLMKIDPYNKYVTDIYFGFSDIDDEAWSLLQNSATSLDFIYNRIRSQYVVYYSGMKLPDDIHVTGYEGVEDKYIREMLSVTNQDGGMLRIEAFGNSEAESEKLADALYQAFENQQSTISQTSYGHSFSVLNRVTKSMIDTDLEGLQKSNRDAIDDYQTKIEDSEQELKELEEPTREKGYTKKEILVSAVKFALIGAVVGLILAAFVVIFRAISKGILLSSYQMEDAFGLECLGVVKGKKGMLERWADKLAGERRWADKEQAVSYVVRKIETKTEPGAKLLLSTTVKNGSVKMDALKDTLIKQGYQVDCVFDAAHDPAFIEAVQNCDGVVFAEKHGKTLLGNTADELKLTESLNKPVHGFVVI